MADIETALRRVIYWASVAMDDSKPNSGLYSNAKSDRDWAERELRKAAEASHDQ